MCSHCHRTMTFTNSPATATNTLCKAMKKGQDVCDEQRPSKSCVSREEGVFPYIEASRGFAGPVLGTRPSCGILVVAHLWDEFKRRSRAQSFTFSSSTHPLTSPHVFFPIISPFYFDYCLSVASLLPSPLHLCVCFLLCSFIYCADEVL